MTPKGGKSVANIVRCEGEIKEKGRFPLRRVTRGKKEERQAPNQNREREGRALEDLARIILEKKGNVDVLKKNDVLELEEEGEAGRD